MTWGKLDDRFHSHPKIVEAGNAGAGLFARLISWSNAHLTDGRVPRSLALMYASVDGPELIARLVRLGLLEERFEDRDDIDAGAFQIRTFLKYNDDAATVRARNDDLRAKRSAAGRAGAAKRWGKGYEAPIAGVAAVQHGKNGKPHSKTVATRSQTDGPDPDPGPDPNESDPDFAISESDKLAAFEVESIGYKKFGALGGASLAAVRRLMPVFRHELTAAMATPGRSWKYAAKVIESYREEHAKGAATPGNPQPPRKEGAFAKATRELAEDWVNGDQPKRISEANGKVAGLLPRKGDGS